MGLQIAALETAILKVLDDSSKIMVETNSSTDNATQTKSAREQTAKELAKAIDTFVKSGLVTTTVTTTGSASAQTGTGTGGIS